MSNHQKSLDLLAEMQDTEGNTNWKNDLLTRLQSALGDWGKNWATKVGFGRNEIQIKYKNPIASMFAFEPLNLLWVQFNILDAQTKKLGKQVLRLGPDTAVLMVLVKVPTRDGEVFYTLVRRKYEFAAKSLNFEFTRGWIPGVAKNDQGWKLFERDFPGLKGNSVVASIKEHKIGSSIWENPMQFSNKISYHLIVVELKDGLSAESIQKILDEAKIADEYQGEKSEDIEASDLKSQPMVLELTEAAKLLNTHLEEDNDKLYLFGENYTQAMWPKFLTRWGWQFPHLFPKPAEKI